MCTTGRPDQFSPCWASQCSRCWCDSAVLGAVICDTVICDMPTRPRSSPRSRATLATTVAASRWSGDTGIAKYIRPTPASAAATLSGRVRSPTTTSAPSARNRAARSSSRWTIARTGTCCARSRSRTVRPTPPAPATRTRSLALIGRSRGSWRGGNAWASAPVAALEPLRARGLEHALPGFLVQRVVVVAQHVAPAAVGALEEEAPGAVVEEAGEQVLLLDRELAHAVDVRLAHDPSYLVVVRERHAEEGRDAADLAGEVRLQVVVVDQQHVLEVAMRPERRGVVQVSPPRVAVGLPLEVAACAP